MALITANGQGAIDTRQVATRIGAWHFDLLVDQPDALTGQVRIIIDTDDQAAGIVAGQVFIGTAVRSGSFVDTAHVRVVAGAGGLGTSATPRHYNGVSVAVVLGDLLAAAGETLSATADQAVLSTGLDAWTTTAAPIGTLIGLLLAAAAPGASWRMLPDGTLWVGTDTFPDAGVDSLLYQIREDAAEQGTMRILVDAPIPLVGTTFEGRKVSATEAHAGQLGEGVTMTVWFEDPAVPALADRLSDDLDAIAQQAAARTDRVDYSRTYPATIIQQSGGTVDVQPDQVGGRDLLADMAGIPLLLGLPGASSDGAQGGKVRIGWLGGDPSKPYAVSFDASVAVQTLVLGVLGQLFLGGQDGSEPPLKGLTFNGLNATLLGALVIYVQAIQAIVEPGGPPYPVTTALTGAISDFLGAANDALAAKVSVL
jgi:hypothetical protein